MSRSMWRGLILVAFFVASAVMIVAGFQGWVVTKASSAMPMQYLGYLLGATALLGCCGVNIWIGGPLDRRKDP